MCFFLMAIDATAIMITTATAANNILRSGCCELDSAVSSDGEVGWVGSVTGCEGIVVGDDGDCGVVSVGLVVGVSGCTIPPLPKG